MCFYIDDDECEFVREKLRWSRKPHKCYECKQVIPHHTFYLHVSGKWHGYVSSFSMCYPCNKLREFVSEYELARGCAPYESSPAFGELVDAVRDYQSEEAAQDPPKDAWSSESWTRTLPDTLEEVEALRTRVRTAYPELKWTTT